MKLLRATAKQPHGLQLHIHHQQFAGSPPQPDGLWPVLASRGCWWSGCTVGRINAETSRLLCVGHWRVRGEDESTSMFVVGRSLRSWQRVTCCWLDCLAINSTRYREYSLYWLVFLYSESSTLYLSLAWKACLMYDSFSRVGGFSTSPGLVSQSPRKIDFDAQPRCVFAAKRWQAIRRGLG
jgi:hypothetical protein